MRHIASAHKTKKHTQKLGQTAFIEKKKYFEDPVTHGKIILECSLNTEIECSLNTEIRCAVDSTGS